MGGHLNVPPIFLKKITQVKKENEDWFRADAAGWDAGAEWSADGELQKKEGKISDPYVIQITNTPVTGEGASTYQGDVFVGNSYSRRTTTNFGNDSHITLSLATVGVTYRDWLSQTESQPFEVGRTMVVTAIANQLEQPVSIRHRDASGKRQDHVMVPTVDPYQSQSDRIIDDYSYTFDGYTEFLLNFNATSGVITIRLYPKNKFVATQLIAGKTGVPEYKEPHIIRVGALPDKMPRPKFIHTA